VSNSTQTQATLVTIIWSDFPLISLHPLIHSLKRQTAHQSIDPDSRALITFSWYRLISQAKNQHVSLSKM